MVPDSLMQRIRAFQESRVLLTAIELDLFSAVAESSEAAAVAARLGTDPRATEMLLNALASLGLVEKDGSGFRNSAEAARYFTRGSVEDARLAMMHQVTLWKRWSTLTECVRSGGPQETGTRGPEWTEAFIAAMDYNASGRAPLVVRAVGAERVRRMLDIGGGSGAYSIAFARANPALEAEIVDLGPVVAIARRHIAAAGLEGRVTARAGDLRAGGFGTGYDLVLISAICHMLSPEENRELLRNAHGALLPGGRVVIGDFILHEDRAGPPQAALFALNMLVGTRAGNTYTESDYKSWMEGAGLREVHRVAPGGPADLIVGSR